MKTLTITKGLPASGKSTWAEDRQDQIVSQGGSVKIINKDKLRGMLDSGKWSQSREKFIVSARNALIREALRAGHHVIVDDTNFGKHEEVLRGIAKAEGAGFEVVDFTHVPVEECLERDKGRPNWVGERVILRMYDQYLRPRPEPPAFIEGARPAIIVDIDGTVALLNGRSSYDETSVLNDKPNVEIIKLLDHLRRLGTTFPSLKPVQVIFVSGRHDTCREDTARWLDMYLISLPGDLLFMRGAEDDRDDRIVKREIYEREIKGRFNVLYVLDDRNKVVAMWRELGLVCLQVAPGDF